MATRTVGSFPRSVMPENPLGDAEEDVGGALTAAMEGDKGVVDDDDDDEEEEEEL